MKIFKYYVFLMILVLFSCRTICLESPIVHYKQGRINQAFELSKQAAIKYPNNWEPYYWIGMCFNKYEKYQEAIGQFKTALEKKDVDKITVYKELKNSYVTIADQFYEQGRIDSCVFYYRLAAKLLD